MKRKYHTSFVRPEPVIVNSLPQCTNRTSIAGYAIAGCAIAGYTGSTASSIPSGTFNTNTL